MECGSIWDKDVLGKGRRVSVRMKTPKRIGVGRRNGISVKGAWEYTEDGE